MMRTGRLEVRDLAYRRLTNPRKILERDEQFTVVTESPKP